MTDRSTIQSVIRYLGLVALVLVVGSIILFREVLDASQGRDALDPAVVAMFGSVTTLAGTTVGVLGSLLVSTRSDDTAVPPDGDHSPAEEVQP